MNWFSGHPQLGVEERVNSLYRHLLAVIESARPRLRRTTDPPTRRERLAMTFRHALPLLLVLALSAPSTSQEPRSVSGIYPHLAMFNDEGECGTGAVVPWAGPALGRHLCPAQARSARPTSSTRSRPTYARSIRPESVGGTPANRMIHRESGQLFIGPYLIDAERKVRVIPPTTMSGRLTGNARHLTDPANKIYYATMEEGLYEVDVQYPRSHRAASGMAIELPGESETQPASPRLAACPATTARASTAARAALRLRQQRRARPKPPYATPTTPSGALAEWDGKPGEDWTSSAATSSPRSPAPAASTATRTPPPTRSGPSAGTPAR